MLQRSALLGQDPLATAAAPGASIVAEIKVDAFLFDPSWALACCPRCLTASADKEGIAGARKSPWHGSCAGRSHTRRLLVVEILHNVGMCGGPTYIYENGFRIRAVGPWPEGRLPTRLRVVSPNPHQIVRLHLKKCIRRRLVQPQDPPIRTDIVPPSIP